MKRSLNFIFIGVISILTCYLLFRNNEIGNILKIFSEIDKVFFSISIFMMAIYLGLEAFMLHTLLNLNSKERIRSWVSIKSMFIGQFYSLLTPFASGGQPMQLVELIRDGVSGVYATAVLINKFLYFQVGVTLYSLVLIVVRWNKTIDLVSRTYGFIVIGVLFNFVGLAIAILMIYRPELIKRIIDFIISVLKILKFKEDNLLERRRRWYNRVDETTNSVKIMMFHKKIVYKLVFYTILQLTAFFAITFFIYKSFRLDESNFADIITMQSILYMSIALIPAPGSAGVAEGGFLIIFGSAFPAQYISTALLLWRGITYYLNLIVSAIVTVGSGLFQSREMKRGISKTNQ